MNFEFQIDPEHAGQRVDRYLAEVQSVASRSQLSRRAVYLVLNGVPVKPSHRLKAGDVVAVEIDAPAPSTVVPEAIPIDVLYEDDDVVVINKAQGMVVHPGAGNSSGTVANALRYHFVVDGPDPERPGIVHRLDKETSGVLVAARNVAANEFLVQQFANRTTIKRYVAIVKGTVSPSSGTIEGVIGRDPAHRIRFSSRVTRGKPAVTHYRCLYQGAGYAYVILEPKTGRTHQLRVHMHDRDTPILGDPLYARRDRRFPEATLMLHAYSLTIRTQPGGPPNTFVAPVPERIRTTLIKLRQ